MYLRVCTKDDFYALKSINSFFLLKTCFHLQYSDLNTTLADPSQLRSKPDVHELKFGQIFTDHMFKVLYHKTLGGWQKPVIIPFENISLHPAAKVLHYAVEVFIRRSRLFM